MNAPSSTGWVNPPFYATHVDPGVLRGTTAPSAVPALALTLATFGAVLDPADESRSALLDARGTRLDPWHFWRRLAESGLADQFGDAAMSLENLRDALGVYAGRLRGAEEAGRPAEPGEDPTAAVRLEPEHAQSDVWPPQTGTELVRARRRWRRT